MLASLAILLLVSSATPAAQSNSLGAPGCGSEDVKFAVKTESKQHPMPSPEPGKALFFFLQDDAKFDSRPRPTTQFGIDGTWVGATQANSYFYVSVDPGEHHLCANWQSFVGAGPIRSTAALHFTAEAGKIYCFAAQDIFRTDHPPAEVVLEALDSDEAQLLMSSFAFSTSQPKK
jgi:hypothetical protein